MAQQIAMPSSTEPGNDSVILALVINSTSTVWLSMMEQCAAQTASMPGSDSVLPSPTANNTALMFDPHKPG